jgi:hypothetical protein
VRGILSYYNVFQPALILNFFISSLIALTTPWQAVRRRSSTVSGTAAWVYSVKYLPPIKGEVNNWIYLGLLQLGRGREGEERCWPSGPPRGRGRGS